MPLFKYKARDQNGGLVEQESAAESVEKLKVGLREHGLWLIEAREKVAWQELLCSPQRESVRPLELVMYTKQMAAMLEAGISLLNALNLLEELASARFRRILNKIGTEIEGGRSYAEGLGLFPGIFSPFYLGMIEAGEESGLLAEMHGKLTEYLEKSSDLKKKLLFASSYPLMVLGATFLGVALILAYAFPKIADTYSKSNTELPEITKVMLAISKFLVEQWYLPLGLIIILVVAIFGLRIHQQEPLKSRLDRWRLKIPFYGAFYQKVILAQFTHNLSLLLQSGLPLLKALEILKNILENLILKGYLDELKSSIEQGNGLSHYLQQNKFFPSLLVAMIRTGEESGNLAGMIMKANFYYTQELEDGVKQFTNLIEPILILLAAGMVFLVLLAFYLPLFQLFKTSMPH